MSARKRPVRTCVGEVAYNHSDSDLSEDEPVRKKRAKVSDLSFTLDNRKKKVPLKNKSETVDQEKPNSDSARKRRVKREIDASNTGIIGSPGKEIKVESEYSVKKEVRDVALSSDSRVLSHINRYESQRQIKQENTSIRSSSNKEQKVIKKEHCELSHHGHKVGSKQSGSNSVPRNDWACDKCGSNNFSWRSNCFRCREHKYLGVSQSSHDNNRGDWLCTNCGSNNFPWRRDCFRCHYDKPYSDNKETTHINYSSSSRSYNNFQDDWTCNHCNCSNFSWRRDCFKCQTYRFQSSVAANIPSLPPKHSENVSKPDKKDKIKLEKHEKSDIPYISNPKDEPSSNSPKTKPNLKTVATKSKSKQNVCKTKASGITDMKSESLEPGSGDDETREFKVSNSELIKECQLIAKKSSIPFNIVKNIINLFNSDATIPFIVRYRSHLIGGLTAGEIRLLKQQHKSVKKLIDKAEKIKTKLESSGYLDAGLRQAIDSCVTQQELDYLYEPYKVLKTSKLVKVIDLKLSTPADNILYGRGIINLQQFVKKDLDLSAITDLIIYYAGEIMSKDSELMDNVRELIKTQRIYLKTNQKARENGTKSNDKAFHKNRSGEVYSNYYNFSCPYDRVKPHQILAINRAESEHVIRVTLDIPTSFQNKLFHFARKKWYFKGAKYELRDHIFNKGLEFMYSKRVSPYLKRHIRSELTKQGEKASLEVFSSNLKYLLLTPPIRNVTVCAVDPGFKRGCKIAILSPQQEILKTDVIYLDKAEHFSYKDCTLVNLIQEFHVDLLVVGNGKGCREVELKISQLMEKNALRRSMKYIVTSECGISVYSCSPEALEEYPNISPNIISAISLAKRVQDPLCELVKVEPKHLGVGMYQHDINEKKLDTVLDDVVSECVSIVGVDVNNAPLRILKKLAGLTESRAKALIETRERKGSFINREELKDVKGIGPKTFQQCAGFIKIVPATCIKTKGKTKRDINYLDQTIIHPEDYGSSMQILEINNLKPEQIGTPECISRLKSFFASENLHSLATRLSVPIETVKLILESLTSRLDYDIRSTFDKPLFRNRATSMENLILNSEVSGRIENVTHFGAFVDIGVEANGLIPTQHFSGNDLHLGQIVRVKINEIDINKMRISLSMVKVESTGQ